MSNVKKIGLYPGTFDPVTLGHLDIIRRASKILDEVVVAVAENTNKAPLFTTSERVTLLNDVIKNEKFECPVRVTSFHGLIVKFAQECQAITLIRGLRAVSDFEYEFQMALMNRHLAKEIETLFLMPDERFVYLSSTIIKVVGQLDGDLKAFLPPQVISALNSKFPTKKT